MRKTFKQLALTLAGVGMFAGAASSTLEEPARLHDRLRSRVSARIGPQESVSSSVLRDALQADPDFSRLLEFFWRASLNSLRGSNLSEDATQQTLLKVWKGRPQIFLQSYDEVMRYIRVAARRNLATEIHRKSRFGQDGLGDPLAFERIPDRETSGPVEGAVAMDLVDQISARISTEDRPVLAALLEGHRSVRRLAARAETTRYRAGKSLEKILEVSREVLHPETERLD